MTIFVKIIIFQIFSLKLSKLVGFKDDSIIKSTHTLSDEDYDILNYGKTNMNLFWVVRNYIGS